MIPANMKRGAPQERPVFTLWEGWTGRKRAPAGEAVALGRNGGKSPAAVDKTPKAGKKSGRKHWKRGENYKR
ncbi:MAG: hypothetical protein Q3W96_02225, partial [Dysosmobacter sp.]|uniref:hypothetical protein n=1 Tax=Dysosmobacter sp. TaxID=2591382 RepID=UPI00284C5DBC